MDGLLSFWVLSTVFAVVGTALKGLIRTLSWATLAIATLFIAPGKVAETVNAVRTGEVDLALPSLPPPPPPVPTATNSPSTPNNDPVPLDPNAAPPTTTTPTTTIRTPPPNVPIANTGWTAVDQIAREALPPITDPTRPSNPSPSPNPTPDVIPAPESPPSRSPIPALW